MTLPVRSACMLTWWVLRAPRWDAFLTIARAGRPQFGIEHPNAEPLGVDLHSVGCPCTRIAHPGGQSRRPRAASCTRLPSRTRCPRPAHPGHCRHPLPSGLQRRPAPSHRRHVGYQNHAQRPLYTSAPSTTSSTSSTSVPPAAGDRGRLRQDRHGHDRFPSGGVGELRPRRRLRRSAQDAPERLRRTGLT